MSDEWTDGPWRRFSRVHAADDAEQKVYITRTRVAHGWYAKTSAALGAISTTGGARRLRVWWIRRRIAAAATAAAVAVAEVW